MIGIVHDRLVELIGPVDTHILLVEPTPTVVMMCGLQGSGKTTRTQITAGLDGSEQVLLQGSASLEAGSRVIPVAQAR